MNNPSELYNAISVSMNNPKYEPGSFGCHEALHMASFLSQAVDTELMQHEAIKQNKAWALMAEEAHDKLRELYDAIAVHHL